MDKPVIIFGAKGIARAALEIFESNGVVVYGFLDPDVDLHQTEINNIPVLGDPDDQGYLDLIDKKCEAFIATDENALREEQVEYLIKQRNVMPTNAIHQNATISTSVEIGYGNFINAGVIIGSSAKIGQHCIINTNVCIEQNVFVKDYVQIGAGSIINEGVKIGKNSFIGSGTTIVAGITVGEGARIGAGSVVIENVKDEQTVFGNPAASIENKK